jgi:hypothetical protein
VSSRRWLRGSAAEAKSAADDGAGVGVGPAGVAGCVHESVVGGGAVQLADVLLSDDGGDVW